ncbi:MAG: MFS transporter [Oscillospiraceae bacterium]|jgi:DHA3 family macrolide efflux protein-like MFS transporter|nr:MFS transporter [Oscillospiraceae bacterium]
MDRWERNATFFVAGQFLSTFGSMLVQHAVTWHITLQTQSSGVMTIFTCAALLPMVFISPFAGVWADRYNRKYLVNLSDGAIALVTLAVALLHFSGFQSIWVLLAAVMARSAGQGVQQPAAHALIPQLVPQAHLARFNGLQSAAQSLTMFAAPMVSGALLTFLPIAYIFLIDIVTAAIGIAIVFFCVKTARPPKTEEKKAGAKAHFHEIAEGLRHIGGTPWLKTLFIAFTLFSVLASPAAMLTPLQVARTFGDDVWRLTAIEILFAAGMTLGSIIMSAWGGFKNKAKTMVFAWLSFGVTTVLFGVIPNFWVYLGVMLLCGCTVPLFNTASMTLMQSKIPPELMGRIFGAVTMLSGLAMPVGMLLFGPLGDVIKIEWLLIVTGVMLILGGFVLRGRKELFRICEELHTPQTEADPTC